MSELLFRLGQFSARRAWLVIGAWIAALALSVGLALTAGGSFTSAMTIDGTPAQRTIDTLQTSFPDASRGTGQAIFHKTDGTPFTEAEKQAIADVLSRVARLTGVDEVIDPFDTQAILEDSAAKLADAPRTIADGQAKIDDGQAKIDDGLKDIEAGWAQIESGRAGTVAGWAELNAAEADLADGRAALEASQAELTAGVQQLDAAEAELIASKAQLEGAIAQMELGSVSEDIIAPYRDNLALVLAGLEQTAAQRAQLDAGQAQLDAGWQRVLAGEAEISAGRTQLVSAESELDAGEAELRAAEIELADAQAELDAAQDELDAAIAELPFGQSLGAATAEFRVVSADGMTAIATIMFDQPITEVPTEQRTAVSEALMGESTNSMTVTVSQDLLHSLDSLLGVGEIVGVAIAIIVLFIMLGTLVGAGLPVFAALIGVGISATITFALSAVVEFTSTTPILGVMLGLAVGIDYALFILNRHRRQLKDGMDVAQSIALANGTSGNSVMFAGLTVIIALAALNLTGIGFLGIMGTMGAMSIAFAVLIAVTFTPAIIATLGLRILSRKERAARDALVEHHQHLPAPSVAPVFATRHPWLASLATVVVLGIVAIPLNSMRLGLPDGSSEPVDSAGYQTYALTEEAFGEGVNGALIVVATDTAPIAEDDELEFQADIADRLMNIDNVAAAIPAGFSDDRTMALFRVIPTEGPNALSTATVVNDLRALSDSVQAENGATVEVTGIAAVNIDVSNKLGDTLPLYLGTVLGLSLLLMILVFRSIAVPIIASAGFLLTVLATLGAVTAVFQWGWFGQLFDVHDPAPILSFLPTILIGILFGLAMDYQLFLASGMREAFVHGKSARDAINHGIHLSRSVVIAAAIIMVSVFGGFVFSHTTMIRPMGFGLAIGVLVDAFVIRLLLVPAVLTLLGDKAWWLPKWLDRILPDVDVEGAKLERSVARH